MSEAAPGPAAAPISPARLPSAKALKARARQQLAKQSRRWQGRVLRVRYRWLDPVALSPPVLTMAVAKKQARRAVDRNRVKRLVREWFRTTGPDRRAADLLVGLSRPWRRHVSEPELLADLQDLGGVLAGGEPHGPADRRGESGARRQAPPAPAPPASALPALPSRPVPPVA